MFCQKLAFVNSCIDIIGLTALAHGQELGTLVVILLVSLSVCHHGKSLSRSSNVNIACSTATGLSPVIGKVILYCNFVSRGQARHRKPIKLENHAFRLQV